MQLRIVTTEREMLSTEVDRVILPGENGQMEILPGHTMLLSMLQAGEIQYSNTSKTDHVLITSGCVEVKDDKILALV
jgi:F-type H+-transporting ATPase subunit epsilon